MKITRRNYKRNDMSLDSVLIIGFSGILSGILMLFLTNDHQIISELKKFQGITTRILRNTSATANTYIQHPNFEKNIDSRLYSFFIDVSFILILLLVDFYVIEDNRKALYVISTICLFLLPFFFSSRSVGELFMHIKIYYWEGEKLNKPFIAILRYICKILFFPLNLITVFKSNIFIEDLIFKTYQTLE